MGAARGPRHEQLVVDAAVHTARLFTDRGFTRIVLVDTASQDVVDRYRAGLDGLDLRVVKLRCDDSERIERLGPRAHLTGDQATKLTAHVSTMTTEDEVIDTSEVEPAAAAQQIVRLLADGE